MKELLIIEKGTLTGIADAVRLKKESTEEIPVEDFAGQITRLPTVTIDGKKVNRDYNLKMSTVWYTVSEMPVTTNGTFSAVAHDGQIHIFSGAINSRYHYVFDGTSWTKGDNVTSGGHFNVIYNDELYSQIWSGVSKWNGTSWDHVCSCGLYSYVEDGTQYGRTYGDEGFVICKGDIYLFGGSNDENDNWDGLWKYDPETNKLIQVSTLPFNPNYYNKAFFVINDEIHCIVAPERTCYHCKWDGNAWTEIRDVPFGASELKMLMLDDGAHFYATGYNADYTYRYSRNHWLFDGTTWTQLEDLGCDLEYGRMVKLGDDIHYLGIGKNYSNVHQSTFKAYRDITE